MKAIFCMALMLLALSAACRPAAVAEFVPPPTPAVTRPTSPNSQTPIPSASPTKGGITWITATFTATPKNQITWITATPPITPAPGTTVAPTAVTPNTPTPVMPTVVVAGCMPNASWEPYTVQRGDTVGGLARRCGTTVNAIGVASCLANPNLIVQGDVIRLPVGCSAAPSPTGTPTPGGSTVITMSPGAPPLQPGACGLDLTRDPRSGPVGSIVNISLPESFFARSGPSWVAIGNPDSSDFLFNILFEPVSSEIRIVIPPVTLNKIDILVMRGEEWCAQRVFTIETAPPTATATAPATVTPAATETATATAPATATPAATETATATAPATMTITATASAAATESATATFPATAAPETPTPLPTETPPPPAEDNDEG